MVTVVIQGPTRFYKEVLAAKSHFSTIWSTWDTEPTENIKAIEDAGIQVALSTLPLNMGHRNINAQCHSTVGGLISAQEGYVFKIRSDMICSDLHKLIDVLGNVALFTLDYDLAFLAYHNWDGGYPVDYCSYGTRGHSMLYWGYQQQGDSNIAPEVQLIKNYISYRPKLKNNFKSLSKHFYFFLPDLIKHDIEITWLKNNLKLSTYTQDRLFLY